MASINYALKEVSCKIVYYGPGLCGKTSNLQYIHQHTIADKKGNLVSLATPGERTLFFDFLPLEAADIHGFRVKFQLYTVPGQVMYNSTRKLVLRGVDGVVFVCDSQWDKVREDLESFRNLQSNLASYGYSLETIPYVVQYNKRDLSNICPVNYLEYVINTRQVPGFEGCALDGKNVFESLNCVCGMVLANLRSKQQEGSL
ncbi:MAG: gliding-motility protein MglA [Armatimonadetes bacterium]|nr:gliding-motility protein MglA [Armatimonadota bacterium]NIO74868.1 gliding-motility protein MglA [Armatimonadota bacterium]NIO95630.1 gliding-motility protein MglA [Armatimonadota bacterium]